jgi:hypothetical protein
MALRCKIFREFKASELENSINNWLESNDDIVISQVTHSEDDRWGTVIIFYARKLEFEKVK